MQPVVKGLNNHLVDQHTACEQGMKISDTGLFIGLQQWQAIQPMHTRWTSFNEIVSMWLLFPFCPPCKFQSSSSNVCVCVREREVVSYYHDRQNITFDTLGCLQTARWMQCVLVIVNVDFVLHQPANYRSSLKGQNLLNVSFNCDEELVFLAAVYAVSLP